MEFEYNLMRLLMVWNSNVLLVAYLRKCTNIPFRKDSLIFGEEALDSTPNGEEEPSHSL